MQELHHAFQMVTAESVRNAMIAILRSLEMWPPAPEVPGALGGQAEESCCYKDMSVPLAVIAHRLYNDEQRRWAAERSGTGQDKRKALTASFIVDFAAAHGVNLQAPCAADNEQMRILRLFEAKSAEESNNCLATKTATPLAAAGDEKPLNRWWQRLFQRAHLHDGADAVLASTGGTAGATCNCETRAALMSLEEFLGSLEEPSAAAVPKAPPPSKDIRTLEEFLEE